MENVLRVDLKEDDLEIYDLIAKQKLMQKQSLNLNAADNYPSKSVLQALGVCLGHKYSRRISGEIHNADNESIKLIELLCEKRALETFRLTPDKWGVNVKLLSGSPANLAVYTAVVGPHGRLMGLDVLDGGHMTHGFMNLKKKLSSSSIFFESLPYKVDQKTGYIDYDILERNARLFKPALIIAGATSYPRHLDYARFRHIADEVDCLLMADMAHISGLVAAGVVPNPFDHCDIVTNSTYKSLRGPMAGMIFYRKGLKKVKKDGTKVMYDLQEKINEAVFPGIQGGTHNHQIAAMAVALKQAQTPQFRNYQLQILANATVLANELLSSGYTLSSGGTDNHLVLLDMRPLNLDGLHCEKVLELINILTNKYAYPGDEDAFKPSGLRLGTPALTTRQMKEDDIRKVAQFVHQGIKIAKELASKSHPSLSDFMEVLKNDFGIQQRLEVLKEEVKNFARRFYLPDFDDMEPATPPTHIPSQENPLRTKLKTRQTEFSG